MVVVVVVWKMMMYIKGEQNLYWFLSLTYIPIILKSQYIIAGSLLMFY